MTLENILLVQRVELEQFENYYSQAAKTMIESCTDYTSDNFCMVESAFNNLARYKVEIDKRKAVIDALSKL